MKLKIITAIAFLTIMIIPISSQAITQMDNGKIKVTPVTKQNFEGLWLRGFDITGQITSETGTKEQISSTHNDLGYHVFLNVNGKHGEMSGKSSINKEQMKDMHYTQVTNDAVQNIDGIDLVVKTKFINNGEQLQINYTLKNTGNSLATFSLGTSADVEIDGDDKAQLEKINNGEIVRLSTKNGNTKKEVQFVFYGKNTNGVTNIDNLWIGGWSDYYLKHIFDTNPNVNKIENQDSAFSFSWVNRKIKAGETQNYSVIIEVGNNNIPQISINQENNAKLYHSNLVINGEIQDKDLKDTVTVHYTIDGKDYTLQPILMAGTSKKFSIDLTKLNLTTGTPHTIKIWATDSTNYKSNVEERIFTITYLKNPKLILTEENWTHNDVQFKITDKENIEQYVKKYQYRINNGEWIDIQKDTLKEISENGNNKIEARIVGNEQNDYSDIITKYVKIDKINPTTDAPTVTKTTDTIIINLEQKDEQSGIDNQKTLYAIKEGKKWSEWQTSNTFTGLKENTTYTVKTKATDNAKNVAESKELVVKTEEIKLKTPNIITKNEFINEYAKFKLNSENSDDNIKQYQFKINNGKWQEIEKNTTYTITNIKEGEITIYARVLNNAGKFSEVTNKKVKISMKENVQSDSTTQNNNNTINNEDKAEIEIPNNNIKTEEIAETDNTIANMKIPKTGENNIILVIIAICLTIAIYSYWKLKNIKE